MPPGPVLLLDSASLYYRSFYALPESMTAPDGRPHNAVRGFLSTLTRLVTQYRPSAVACCWDDDWRPAWRVDLLPSYKTHRLAADDTTGVISADANLAEAAPESLGAQAEAIGEIVTAMGLARPGASGFEADDIIATLAASASGSAIVVSGDRDLVQVVRPGVRMLLTVNGGMDKWPLLDDDAVVERFGVSASRYVDLAVLRGDPSDGIPGVPGIGPKTAGALITSFGGLDELLGAVDAGAFDKPLTPRLAGLLDEHRDLIGRMRTVASARIDAPIHAADIEPTEAKQEKLTRIASAWGVTRFVDEAMRALEKASETQTVDE